MTTEPSDSSSTDSNKVQFTAFDYLNKDRFLSKVNALDEALTKKVAQIIPDPLVLKTNWRSVSHGGINIRSHDLRQISSERYEFRSTGMNKGFRALIILAGAGPAIGMVLSHLANGEAFSGRIVFGIFLCLVMAAAGVYMFIQAARPIVFDRGSGYFYNGRKDPLSLGLTPIDEPKDFARLKDIHALQLIVSLVKSSSANSYTSYELNAVLRNGKRICIVSHGDREAIAADAARLGKFIGKPVWDAIDCTKNFLSSF